jgi:hypothetical protein
MRARVTTCEPTRRALPRKLAVGAWPNNTTFELPRTHPHQRNSAAQRPCMHATGTPTPRITFACMGSTAGVHGLACRQPTASLIAMATIVGFNDILDALHSSAAVQECTSFLGSYDLQLTGQRLGGSSGCKAHARVQFPFFTRQKKNIACAPSHTC